MTGLSIGHEIEQETGLSCAGLANDIQAFPPLQSSRRDQIARVLVTAREDPASYVVRSVHSIHPIKVSSPANRHTPKGLCDAGISTM